MTHNTSRPNSSIERITPADAAALLARNTHNRKVSQRNYTIILRAIRNGEWRLNGEAIKISANGTILDGQHRLLAVVESGQTIETFVIRGLPEETQETMDTGKSRGLNDILALRGEKNSSILAAIVRRVHLYETNSLKAATIASYPTTNPECLKTLEALPQIRDIVQIVKHTAPGTKMPASLAGILYYAFAGIDVDDADFFFERLTTGEHLSKGDPIYELRATLSRLKESRGQQSQTYMAALAVKAWNKYRKGETVSILKFSPGGATPETFPEPI